MNRFTVIIIALVVGFVGLFWFTKDKADAPTNGGSGTAQASSHTYGNTDSEVVLIEYGDFECPACAQYFPLVSQIKEKYKDDITFQFRHFPLVQIHRNAMASHRAAEAAAMQGKFWEMHDLLYQQQDAWKNESNPARTFEGYAQSIGLDVEKFKTDVASAAANDAINADIKEGQNAGANSTPTFVLNGKKIDNPTTLEEFEKLIEDALKEQSSADQ